MQPTSDQTLRPATRLTVGGLAGVEHVSLTELLKRSGGQPSKRSPKPTRQSSSGAIIKPGTTLPTHGRWNEKPIVTVTRLRALEQELTSVQSSLTLPPFSNTSQNSCSVSPNTAQSTLNQTPSLLSMVPPESVQVVHAQSAPKETNLQPGQLRSRCTMNQVQITQSSNSVDSVCLQTNRPIKPSTVPICSSGFLSASTSEQTSVRKLNCYSSLHTYVRMKGPLQPPTCVPNAAAKTQNVSDRAMKKNFHSALPGCDGFLSIARKRVENLPMATIKIRTPKRSMLICNKANKSVSRSSQVTLKGDRPHFGKKTTAGFLEPIDPILEQGLSYHLLDGCEDVRPGFLSCVRNVNGKTTSPVEEDKMPDSLMPGAVSEIDRWQSHPINGLLGSGTCVQGSHQRSSNHESLYTSSGSSSLGISPTEKGPPVEISVFTVQTGGSNGEQTTEDNTSTMYGIGISRLERYHAEVAITVNTEEKASKPQAAIFSNLPTTEEQSNEIVRIGLTDPCANRGESGPWSIEAFDLFEWRPPT